MSRKIIGIKHHLSSGCCMCSGIEDLYATRTNQSIPEGFLLALGSFGETVFIKMNNSEKPYMFSANDARPKTVYENLKEELGLDYKIIGGTTVKYAKKSIKKEIDEGNPVILGPLDMFYLPYLKMYHAEHIPIHYVMMTGYDEEKDCVLIYDCDREEMIELAMSDLELAWDIEKNGVGDKNGFIKIRLGDNLPDKYTLSRNCLLKKQKDNLGKNRIFLEFLPTKKLQKNFRNGKRNFQKRITEKLLFLLLNIWEKCLKCQMRLWE